MSGPAIPTNGVLIQDDCVLFAWPEADEFDSITALRNASWARRWFVDDRVVDPVRNREWLSVGMNRPTEALLSIRSAAHGTLIGICGWSDWRPNEGTVCYGRFVLDLKKIAQMRLRSPSSNLSLGLHCGILMRNFAFVRLKVDAILSSYIANNAFAARLNKNMGLRPIGRTEGTRTDGRPLSLVHLQLTRGDWERLVQPQCSDL